jgi:hypothetical protein
MAEWCSTMPVGRIAAAGLGEACGEAAQPRIAWSETAMQTTTNDRDREVAKT